MSLVKLIKKKGDYCFFTTPSHSQKFFIFSKLRQFYKSDISETDFHNPQEALASAQNRAAEIYGTKGTFFLTNGSTSGIIAAVQTCAGRDDGVLIWDEAHPAHGNACFLAGAREEFYSVQKDSQWGIFGVVEPSMLEKKLIGSKIKAVIVTSPTYEGVVSDIKAIKEVCKKHGAYLIVDEAHGALYPFSEKLPKSAINLGADFVIQSLHKTAGGLNPTALLHCNTQSEAVSVALERITTTSPSYPLLASIEKNISFLNSKKGRKMLDFLIEEIAGMKKNLPGCEFYEGDATKIVVKISGMSGYELSEKLYGQKIEDERANEKSVLLLTGIGTDSRKLQRLQKALKKLI